MGTASDRYHGWIGQIYLKDYSAETKKRVKTFPDLTLEEAVLPIESVQEYFEHFELLEIDFTFYGLLLDSLGRRTSIYKTLKNYKEYLKSSDKLILKVPQVICARKILKKNNFTLNDNYLNTQLFMNSFFEPCLELLKDNLFGLIFEQEYHSKLERMSKEEVTAGWLKFFENIPQYGGYHLELRTPAYITPELTESLARMGVGIVLSHWTWLPPLKKQFKNIGERVTNKGSVQIIRLMTPRNIRYEDAYKRAYPFDKIKYDLLDFQMIDDTVYLIKRITLQNGTVCVVINNRAGGNAPEIARLIKGRLQNIT